jgi:hypothetical protein
MLQRGFGATAVCSGQADAGKQFGTGSGFGRNGSHGRLLDIAMQ